LEKVKTEKTSTPSGKRGGKKVQPVKKTTTTPSTRKIF